MLHGIIGVFKSKKGLMVIIGTLLVAILTQAGVDIEIVKLVAGLFGVGVAAQGVADFGKEKAKVEKGIE